MKVSSAFLALVATMVLARSLGPHGYGIYAYVYVIISVIAVPLQLGLPNLVVRETARNFARENWDLMLGLWRWASIAVGLLCLVLVAVVWALALTIGDRFTHLDVHTAIWGLVLVPFIALGALRGAALKGLNRVLQGQLPEMVLRPGLLVLFVCVVLVGMPDTDLTPPFAMALHVTAAASAYAVGAWLLRRGRPDAIKRGVKRTFRSRIWLLNAIPLALSTSMQVINHYTDIVMLGIFGSPENVGVYRVATQMAGLVVFSLQAVNQVVAPRVARLYHEDNIEELQRIVTVSTWLYVGVAMPIAAVFLAYGDHVLEELFGLEYAEGAVVLAILTGGQVVNILMGSVGMILNMTGHERQVAGVVGVVAVLNILLNLFMIPIFGMKGAALSTAVTTSIWNIVLWMMVRKAVGIRCTVLGV